MKIVLFFHMFPLMAMHRLSFLFSNNHSLYAEASSLPKPRSKPSLLTSALSASSHSHTKNDFNHPIVLSRRVLLSLSIINVSVLGCNPFSSSLSMATNQVLALERYTDAEEGFTLLKPSSWIKVEKAGATVLFEEANKGSNNVGIVVSPVRISSLEEFGSPQFVADKLIEAERRKESTKEAEVISVSERSGNEGVQVYEFEYKVDSTRGGMKRVFSAAFVASNKLYLLNISNSDGLDTPLDTDKRMVLEQVLHSFDIAPST